MTTTPRGSGSGGDTNDSLLDAGFWIESEPEPKQPRFLSLKAGKVRFFLSSTSTSGPEDDLAEAATGSTGPDEVVLTIQRDLFGRITLGQAVRLAREGFREAQAARQKAAEAEAHQLLLALFPDQRPEP